MLIYQVMEYYNKEYSTNQLIDRQKFTLNSKSILIRFNREVFNCKFHNGYFRIFKLIDGTIDDAINKYDQYYKQFIKLMNKFYKIIEINDPMELNSIDPTKSHIVISMIFNEKIHEFSKHHKLFYISLL